MARLNPSVVVVGAGAIGAFVGGALSARGVPVTFIGRGRMLSRLATDGLSLSGLAVEDVQRPASALDLVDASDAPAVADALQRAALVLVAVKARDAAAVCEVVRNAPPTALVCALQNGVGHEARLGAALPTHRVLAGMVPFNVAVLPGGRLHRATSGEIIVQASEAWAPWRDAFRAAGLPLSERADMRAVQWGKLLLNLNNAVNALSNQPLKAQLADAGYRRVLAALIGEALAVLDAAGIAPARVGRVPPRFLPGVLRLPDVLFTRVAGSLLRVDPEARSSMWEDLQTGRETEVDALNGAVVELAAHLGRQAPRNQAVCALVHAAESGGRRAWSAEDLERALAHPHSD